MLPPFQTPHSTMAPGIRAAWTYSTARMSATTLSGLVIVKGRTAQMSSISP
jgi:hypothetical protein